MSKSTNRKHSQHETHERKRVLRDRGRDRRNVRGAKRAWLNS